MKTKLLKKIRKNNIIYVRNNEYRYISITNNGFYTVDTGWTTNLKECLFQQREKILKEARLIYKPAKKTL
jgi:hypothetical protein